ncbi:MAG TPA: helix-turn-helix domain-containing protein [Polyangiaceae bacterium]|nr:helix-turn-helix domain-containing protein [Polyangiaceae bacterium]
MTTLVVVDAEELRRLIREAVADALPNSDGRDEWVDARTSGLGRRTFLRLAREGAFPVSKVGKRYVTRRRDLAAYLETQRVGDAARLKRSRGRHALDTRRAAPRKPPAPTCETDDPVARALAQGRLRVLKGST